MAQAEGICVTIPGRVFQKPWRPYAIGNGEIRSEYSYVRCCRRVAPQDDTLAWTHERGWTIERLASGLQKGSSISQSTILPCVISHDLIRASPEGEGPSDISTSYAR